MKRVGFGIALLLLGLLAFWSNSDGESLTDRIGVLLVFALPAVWLIFFGWRSRWGQDHPWRKLIQGVLLTGTLAPFLMLLSYVIWEGFKVDALLEPLVKGEKSPQTLEADLLNYAQSGWKRGDTAARALIEASVPGSESLVIALLKRTKGEEQKGIAVLMLNSGNPPLEASAASWAGGAGYAIVGKRPKSPKWQPKDKR